MDANTKQNILDASLEVRQAKNNLSANKTAKEAGINPGTYSRMINKDWESISDAIWMQLAKWANYNPHTQWPTISTPNFERITKLCKHAKGESIFKAISGFAGAGKTHTLKHFSSKNENTYYISCEEYFTRKLFLQEIASAMGIEIGGSIPQIIRAIIAKLSAAGKPLLIIDEADKLKDPVINLIKSIYNQTEGRSGIVIAGADFLKERITKNVERHKMGFDELYSRMGRQMEAMVRPDKKILASICDTFQIQDTEFLNEMADTAKDYRQVRRMITDYRYKLQMAA